MPPTEAQRAAKKKYYLANLELCLQRSRDQRAQPGHQEHMGPIKRRSMLKQRYGITDADYVQMLHEQDGKCAICRTDNPNNGKGNRFFDVDHCHKTGKVRGLLCRDCNATVGVIEGKPAKVLMIRDYLSRYT